MSAHNFLVQMGKRKLHFYRPKRFERRSWERLPVRIPLVKGGVSQFKVSVPLSALSGYQRSVLMTTTPQTQSSVTIPATQHNPSKYKNSKNKIVITHSQLSSQDANLLESTPSSYLSATTPQAQSSVTWSTTQQSLGRTHKIYRAQIACHYS